MELNGQPFVPPNCPNDKAGDPFLLSPDQFRFYVHNTPSKSLTEAWGSFCQDVSREQPNDLVETADLQLDIDSRLAVLANRVANTIKKDESIERRMGAIFCQRVIKCQGVVNGECWALGVSATEQVIEEVAGERG